MITYASAQQRTEEVKERNLAALEIFKLIAEQHREDPLTKARLRGIDGQRQLLMRQWHDSKFEVVSDLEVAFLLGITSEAVEDQHKQNKLIGLFFGTEVYLYPRWQFANGEKLRGLEAILSTLSEVTTSPHTMTQFFFTEMYGLPDKVTPYKYLTTGGDINRVKWIASTYLNQGWNS